MQNKKNFHPPLLELKTDTITQEKFWCYPVNENTHKDYNPPDALLGIP